MANRLNEDLTGRVVLIDAEYMKPEYADPARRAFVVSGGFGAKSFTTGNAVFGAFLFDGEQCRIEGWQGERFATEDEIEAAQAIREQCSTCGKPSDEFVDGDCPDCNPPVDPYSGEPA